MSEKFSREQFAAKLGANGDPKLTAAADFAARLLNGPMGEHIERIMLFGSVATGDARPESDIDVMVFGDAPREQLSAIVADTSFESSCEFKVDVNPIARSVNDMVRPRSYLVHDTLKRGREVFVKHPDLPIEFMVEEQMSVKGAMDMWRKAEMHFEHAQGATSRGHFEPAVVSAYTAAELAARALIILRPNLTMPSTHDGTIQIFSREYVKTGEAPIEWPGLLNRYFKFRNDALYEAASVMTQADAQPIIDFAREILDFLKRKLEETESDNPN